MVILKLKLAIRTLLRAGIFSYLNVLGLAVAFGVTITIYVFVRGELTTDTHFSRSDEVYRIVREVQEPNASYHTPTLAGPFYELIHTEAGMPLSQMTRVYNDDELVSYEAQTFFEKKVYYVDRHFFEVLDYELRLGDRETALHQPNACVVSARMARKYFGDSNPLGELLEIEGKGRLEVTGVLADPVVKSHLDMDFVVNNLAMGYTSRFLTSKDAHAFSFYMQIPKKQRLNMDQSLDLLTRKYLNDEEHGSKSPLKLQPLAAIYFDEPMMADIAQHGDRSMIRTLLAIAAILLLVTAANAANLSIARLSKGVKQVGLKKLLGSSKRSLVWDWALEIFAMTLLGTLIGALAAYLTYPSLSAVMGFNLEWLSLPQLAIWSLGFTMVLTAVILVIPALVFSSVNPFSALSGKLGHLKTNLVQYALLCGQFVVAFVLMVLTVVIVWQFQYMQDREVGLDADQVLIFNSTNKHSWKNRAHIKNAIAQLAEVKGVSMVYGGLPSSPCEVQTFEVDQLKYQWNTAFVQPNIITLLDLKVVEGNAFDPQVQSEAENSVLLNERAARALGWPQISIVGNDITISGGAIRKRILGIVKDYHYESFKSAIEPLVLQATGWEETFVVKLAGRDHKAVLTEIERIWSQYVPKYPLAYRFLDDTFQHMHREDTKNGKIIFLFTLLTLVMISLGTLSLGAFIQQSKVKEIAIRKVLGAPLLSILSGFSFIFFKVLFLASLVAIPAAWFFASNWLNDFSYRIQLSPLFFLVGLLTLSLMVLLLVISQSWRSANSNPVHSLRLE